MKYRYLIFLTLLFPAIVLAGETDFASTGYARGAAEYLKLPRHAYSASLAGAVIAWQADQAGFQYNPSILDAINSNQRPVVATYSFMTLDRKHIAADAMFGLGSYLAGALSLNSFSVGNIEGRDNFGNFVDDFDYQTFSVAASIAGRLQWPVSWGITLRYLSEHLDVETGNGFGLDLGATWKPLKQLCIGLSGQNIGSYLFWSADYHEQVLPVARFGIAGMFLDTTLTVELDAAKTPQQPVDVSLGIQYKLFSILSLRAGATTSLDIEGRDYRDFDFAFGVGMRYSMFGFDYAIPITSSKLGLTHKVSVIVNIPGR